MTLSKGLWESASEELDPEKPQLRVGVAGADLDLAQASFTKFKHLAWFHILYTI